MPKSKASEPKAKSSGPMTLGSLVKSALGARAVKKKRLTKEQKSNLQESLARVRRRSRQLRIGTSPTPSRAERVRVKITL